MIKKLFNNILMLKDYEKILYSVVIVSSLYIPLAFDTKIPLSICIFGLVLVVLNEIHKEYKLYKSRA